jgi:hypothetical protein
LRFLINNLYDGFFQSILESSIIPLAVVQKIGGCGSMLVTYFGEVYSFPPVTTEENGNNDSHQMVQVHIG